MLLNHICRLTGLFRCNICGKIQHAKKGCLKREEASCSSCFSTVRKRQIFCHLSRSLFGKARCLQGLKADKKIKGVGLSDRDGYASRLVSLFQYTNTFYHQEPKLYITSPEIIRWSQLDFLISSDVFEHVLKPVQAAFDGA
jgi:hypothetical protein